MSEPIQVLDTNGVPATHYRSRGDDTLIHVWLTKHALTEGIVEVPNARHCLSSCPNGSMIDCSSKLGLFAMFHGEGKNWHRTWESAVKKAEQMRINKIAAYKKSIKKLEGLKFE